MSARDRIKKVSKNRIRPERDLDPPVEVRREIRRRKNDTNYLYVFLFFYFAFVLIVVSRGV